MTKESKTSIVVALITVIGGTGAGYYSGLAAIGERVRAVEVRQEEQFDAILVRITAVNDRINDVGARTRQGHEEIRSDLNGIRGEIMAMLRQR